MHFPDIGQADRVDRQGPHGARRAVFGRSDRKRAKAIAAGLVATTMLASCAIQETYVDGELVERSFAFGAVLEAPEATPDDNIWSVETTLIGAGMTGQEFGVGFLELRRFFFPHECGAVFFDLSVEAADALRHNFPMINEGCLQTGIGNDERDP